MSYTGFSSHRSTDGFLLIFRRLAMRNTTMAMHKIKRTELAMTIGTVEVKVTPERRQIRIRQFLQQTYLSVSTLVLSRQSVVLQSCTGNRSNLSSRICCQKQMHSSHQHRHDTLSCLVVARHSSLFPSFESPMCCSLSMSSCPRCLRLLHLSTLGQDCSPATLDNFNTSIWQFLTFRYR